MSLNPSHLDPDDPRLTAYALGELTDPAERAEVEQMLADSPAARAEVEEIRAFTAALSAEYDQERAAASEAAAPASAASNVIALPTAARRFGWVSPLLKIAAVLLVLGVLGYASLPVFNSAQVKASRTSAEARAATRWMMKEQAASDAPAAPVASAPVTPPEGASAAAPAPMLASEQPPLQEAERSRQALASPMLAQNEPLTFSASLQDGKSLLPRDESANTMSSDSIASEETPAMPAAAQPAENKKTLLATQSAGESKPSADAPAARSAAPAVRPAPEHPAQEAFPAEASSVTLGQSQPAKPKIVFPRPATAAPGAINQPVFVTRTDKDGNTHREFGGYVNYGSPIQGVQPGAAPAAPAAPGTAIDDISRLTASESVGRRGGSGGAAEDLAKNKTVLSENRQVLGGVPTVGRLFRSKAESKPNVVAASKKEAISGEDESDAVFMNTPDGSGDAAFSVSRSTITTRSSVARTRAPNTATYDRLIENPFLTAKDNPLSTFSIDVDTASYANVRRFIESGSLPPKDAIRIEELLNYFPYDYAPPAPGEESKPFAIHLEAAACPWALDHRLVRVGIKGRELPADKRPPSNLVFLLDVSGSMSPAERLPLIKDSLRLLVEQLTENDRVAIVVYAGASGLALPSTTGDHKERILRSLEDLRPGGSTNGASGIQLAYKVAQDGFIKGGTNRVILATDGDFNVGVTNQGDLVRLIEEKAKSGVFLSVLGVGTDNYKDSTMQKLADKGNGNYSYIDRIEEGKKVLVEQMAGTLVTIAKDVKIQVEFNPTAVAAYRLIGYEKRMLRKEDFNNDKIDAGEIGAGHSVTALYEIVPIGQKLPQAAPALDPLKYQAKLDSVPTSIAEAPEVKAEPPDPPAAPAKAADAAATRPLELLTVKMRHKAPDADKSERTLEEALIDRGAPGEYANATPDFKFAAAVASFGLSLRDSPYKGDANLGAAIELAQEGKGADANGYRTGFIELARRAQSLQGEAGSQR